MNFLKICLVALLFSDTALAQADTSLLPQDYKCGISLRYSGTEGVDYIAEDMFHEPLQNNRRTVYIKDTTDISMYHNELNVIAQGVKYHQPTGAAGVDGIAGNDDDGTIRYRIDGDLHGRVKWSDRPIEAGAPLYSAFSMLPAYSAPFAFKDLSYTVGGSVRVVGAIGGNGQPITNRALYYHRGMLDSSGDEWHVMSIGDDDWAYVGGVRGLKEEFWASDGKMQLYVVNPKTPCITVARTGDAQFYTTPAKTYFVPKIHDQTTYILPRAGTVSVKLTDIYGGVVEYRLNGGSWTTNGTDTVTLVDSAFTSGSNTLECRYAATPSVIRTRTVVKNPAFPSAGETHGNLMWADAAELAKITGRLTRAPYMYYWNKLRTDKAETAQDLWLEQGHKGKRWPWYPRHPSMGTRAFENAFVALVQGWDSSGADSKGYARYAKEMLLDNVLNLDFIGFEQWRSNSAIPSNEVKGAGYYMVYNIFNYVAGYDLMIANYRSDQRAHGITPIEDHFMRDQMAGYAMRQMQWYGQVQEMEPGMWGTAEGTGALMVCIAMPNYNTPYYGTSGFNGTTKATHAWTPYPDLPRTWKEVFVDQVAPTLTYPNQKWPYNPVVPQGGALLGTVGAATGYWTGSNLGYWQLMSTQYYYLTNLSALHTGVEWPVIKQAFSYAVQGTMLGLSGNGTSPVYTPLLGAINSRHPTVEALGRKALLERNTNGVPNIRELNDLLWYDDGRAGNPPSAPKNLRPVIGK